MKQPVGRPSLTALAVACAGLASAVAAGLAAASVAGCATVSPAVNFAARPAEVPPASYEGVRARWMRHGHITHDFDTALDVNVFLLSPEYRVAYVDRVADLRKFPPADRAALLETQRKEGAEFVDAVVLLQASRWEWNDLSSSVSVWTITLTDDHGRSVSALTRMGVMDKPDDLGAIYGGVTPFVRAWKVRFPAHFTDGTELLHADAKWVAIRFAGPLGDTEMRWAQQ